MLCQKNRFAEKELWGLQLLLNNQNLFKIHEKVCVV